MSVLASNISASASSGQNNEPKGSELIKLLEEVNDRLKRSESERELLWRELDEYRKILNEMEDKTHSSEKAYLSLEHKLVHRDKMTEEMMERQEKLENSQNLSSRELEEYRTLKTSLEKRLMDQEGMSDSVLKRAEEAIAAVSKMDRRFDRFNQDKGRLLRKIERMENIIEETQDALRAKALVLLTDQTVARAMNQPQINAWDSQHGFSPPPLTPDQSMPAGQGFNESSEGPSLLRSAVSLMVLAAFGLAGGYGLAVMFKSKPSNNLLSQVVVEKTQVQATPEQDSTQASIKLSLQGQIDAEKKLALEDEQKAIAILEETKDPQQIRERAQPDTTLPKTLRAVEKKAFAGDAQAQSDLASVYAVGQDNVAANTQKAAFWFREAGLNNVAAARYNLGVMFHQGLGMDKNLPQATLWYQAAASKGHPEALYNLGISYLEGTGSSYNPVRAAGYFERAAVAGVADAAYNLGLIYENAVLGKKELPLSAFWFKLASDRGSPQGKEALARLQSSEGLSQTDIEKIFTEVKNQRSDLKLPALAQTPQDQELSSGGLADNEHLITQLQSGLASIDLFSGPADGRMTDELANAIRAYQTKIGLTPDGLPSRDILDLLKTGRVDVVVPAAGEE